MPKRGVQKVVCTKGEGTKRLGKMKNLKCIICLWNQLDMASKCIYFQNFQRTLQRSWIAPYLGSWDASVCTDGIYLDCLRKWVMSFVYKFTSSRCMCTESSACRSQGMWDVSPPVFDQRTGGCDGDGVSINSPIPQFCVKWLFANLFWKKK